MTSPSTEQESSTPPGAGERPERKPAPSIGVLGMARWTWRQLTSMRTALLLLFLLALGAVPGSLIPQRGVNPVEVMDFVERNPGLSAWYERLGLFDVFGSVWFGAIYLLLMISLLGCILPRTAQHWRVMRARPPAAPRRLQRMPEHRTWTTADDPKTVLAAAETVLRSRRYRVVDDGPSIAAERGYLREIGNLLFHVAIVVVLVGVAVGSLLGFKGTAVIVEGNGFANTITQYDGYQGGRFFAEPQLPPFALTVKSFEVRFETRGQQRGAAREFDAVLDYTEAPGQQAREYHLRINHPLDVGGAEVHLIGHGYAPRFTVRDGAGDVAFSGAVPFLPQDGNFSSTGVVKVPDARPDQLGFQGFFLPTATVDPERGPVSAFPDALNQQVYLTAYRVDLGMDTDRPQSVYKLELDGLEQIRKADGDVFRFALSPGQGAKLPGGGSITFEGFDRWVNLQVSRNPGNPVALTGAALALVGLLLSLVVRRRRAWVRVTAEDGKSVVEVAGLDKTEGGDLAAEIDEIVAAMDRPTRRKPAEEEPG